MTHWAELYIGDSWVAGEHDCWGFVRRVYSEQFSIDVPVVDVDSHDLRAGIRAFDGHPERARWQETAVMRDGDAVLMGQGQRAHHVGIWCDVDGGGVVHAIVGAGVVFQSRTALELAGWHILAAYRRSE